MILEKEQGQAGKRMKHLFGFRATYGELKKMTGEAEPKVGWGVNARHTFKIEGTDIDGDYRFSRGLVVDDPIRNLVDFSKGLEDSFEGVVEGRAFWDEKFVADEKLNAVRRYFSGRMGREIHDFKAR